MLAHVGAVNDVRLHIAGRSPESQWVCERQLARERVAGEHLCDALVLTREHTVAIEVELTVKSKRRVETILDELSERYQAVLYFCAPGPLRQLTSLAETSRWPALGVRELPRRTRSEAPRMRWPRERQTVSEASAPERLLGQADGERGVTLARRLGGERALPLDGGLVFLSADRLCHHLLVCGATGSGKTETLLRLAWGLAKSSDAPIFYLDGKGDRENARRFCGLMADAGREVRVFPNQPFDGWRGDAHEIQGRLMEVIDYASEGPAAWYRDLAKNALRLACQQPEGPPRCSLALLERLELGALSRAYPGASALRSLKPEQVSQVRLRYEAFFGQTRGALDGSWAWEDTDAAYVLLDSLSLREEASGLSRLLFEDFAHYFSSRKPKERFCLLIVDEFSALANSGDMAGRIEQARGFRTSLVLAPQAVAGMGDRVQAERILSSVQSVICHRVNTPEQIVALAGTHKRMEYSSHFTQEGATGEGSARVQHQFKVDPNRVRGLEPGQAYAISAGRAMRIQVLRAPAVYGELPERLVHDHSALDSPSSGSPSASPDLSKPSQVDGQWEKDSPALPF